MHLDAFFDLAGRIDIGHADENILPDIDIGRCAIQFLRSGTSGPSLWGLFHPVSHSTHILKRRCHQPLRASRGSPASASADSATATGSETFDGAKSLRAGARSGSL